MPKRGTEGENQVLGAFATSAGRTLVCGDCSPEPLNLDTVVFMRVRACGLVMSCGEHHPDIHVDVIECPICGKQVIR